MSGWEEVKREPVAQEQQGPPISQQRFGEMTTPRRELAMHDAQAEGTSAPKHLRSREVKTKFPSLHMLLGTKRDLET